MARYIDAEKVMEDINRIGGHNLCEWETISRQPTADVVEVKHGEWIDNVNGTFTCSVCGRRSSKMDWCGHCGAKMDGRRDT